MILNEEFENAVSYENKIIRKCKLAMIHSRKFYAHILPK